MSITWRSKVSSLACAMLVAAWSGEAAAQEHAGSARAEARALFRAGLEHAERQAWREAAEAFQQSLARIERPGTLFNLAQALLRLGRYTEAVRVFDRFLAVADPREDRREIAEATPARAEARAAIATLDLADVPEGATVLLDGRTIEGTGPTRAIEVDPGDHVVEVRASDGRSVRHASTTARGAHDRWAVALAPPTPPPDPPAPTGPVATPPTPATTPTLDAQRVLAPPSDTRADAPRTSSIVRSPWLWAGVGVGVAAVVTVVLVLTLGGGTTDPYRGSTGVVLEAATSR